MITRFVSRLLIACLATVLVSAAPRAHAQLGLGGMGAEMGELIKPSTNARLLKQYAEILSLTPDQKRTADDLLIAYQTEFRDNVARLEEIYSSVNEEIADTADYELNETVMMSVMTKFLKKSSAINNSFMTDLKAILTPEQAERFPQVERLQRRSGAIKIGLEGVERVNLLDIVAGLRLDPAAATGASGPLEQYAVETDKELVARDRMFREFIEKAVKLVEEGKRPQEDPEVFMKFMNEVAEAGKRIAAINKNYIGQIRAALPENVQGEYDAQVKLATYPAIYRRTYGARVFDAVETMTDLDVSQKDGIRPLKEAYFRDIAAANDKWAAVLTELRAETGNSMMSGGMWQIRQNPKYTEARTARTAVDDKAVESVKALLNESQRSKLPKKNYRAEWDFDRQAAH